VEVDGRLLIEAYLLDFDEDIYDTRITIEFLRWLRGEQRFDSVDELIAQLELDVVRARIATD
jgi:riboflavin kinase/FMN adenylyltransferase